MSKKEEYQKTIDELQKEIEAKARELQKETEKFDALQSNKLQLNQRITELTDEVTARRSVSIRS